MESDPFPYESILGINRIAGQGPEYFVKLKGKAYKDCIWVPDKLIRQLQDGSSFISKAVRSGLPSTPPFYDLDFEIVDKIISQSEGDLVLVKWAKQQYDQLTYEPISTIAVIDMDRFLKLTAENMPLKNGDISNDFCLIEDFVEDLNSRELNTFEYIKDRFLTNNIAHIKDQLQLSSHSLICKIIDGMLRNTSEKGPILVITGLSRVEIWNDVIRDLSECVHHLSYTGNKDNRKKIQDIDFMLDDDHLKFNIMITTPEILETDYELIKSINWRLVISEEDNDHRSFKTRHYRLIRLLNPKFTLRVDIMSVADIAQAVLDFHNICIEEKEFDQEEIIKSNKVKEILSPISIQQSKQITTKELYVETPLSKQQCAAVQKVLFDNQDSIKHKQFGNVAQQLLEVYTHPQLVYPNMECSARDSTKFNITIEIVLDNVTNGQAVLIMSQSVGVLDILEDAIISCNYNVKRFSASDADALGGSEIFMEGDFAVFLYDASFAPQLDAPLHLIQTAILVDVPFSSYSQLARVHSNGRSPTNAVEVINILDTSNCFEAQLRQECSKLRDDESESKSKSDTIHKIEGYVMEAAIRSHMTVADLNPWDLIYRASFDPFVVTPVRTDFEAESFWEMYFKEVEPPVIQWSENTSNSKNWTVTERDRLIRWLMRISAGRISTIANLGMIHRSDEEISIAIRGLIRELLRLTSSNAQFVVPKGYLIEDEAEQEKSFVRSQPVFMIESFQNWLKSESTSILRRIEANFFLNSLFEHKMPSPDCVPLLNLSGIPPAPWWRDQHDRELLFTAWRDGVGVYDHVLFYKDILGNGPDKIPHVRLDDRVSRLCECAKRLELSDEKVADQLSRASADDGWTASERNAVLRAILRKGLTKNADGERDIATIKTDSGLLNKEDAEVGRYIDFIMHACECPSGEITPEIAQRLTQRISDMDNLRRLLDHLDESSGPEFFEKAPRWRMLPSSWTPRHEWSFFVELGRRGLGEIGEILEQPEFDVFGDSGIPQFLLSDYCVMRRAENLVAFKNDPNSFLNKSKSKSKSKHDEDDSEAEDERKKAKGKPKPKPKPKSKDENKPKKPRPITFDELEANADITYPVLVTPTSSLINIGSVISNRNGWHTERYIYPAGYKSSRVYTSCLNPDEQTTYISEIIDRGSGPPLFRVTVEEDESVSFESETPSGCWVSVLKAIAAKKADFTKKTISGPESFLLSHRIVAYLIQKLPGVENCVEFVRRDPNELRKGKDKSATPRVQRDKKENKTDEKEMPTKNETQTEVPAQNPV